MRGEFRNAEKEGRYRRLPLASCSPFVIRWDIVSLHDLSGGNHRHGFEEGLT